ncbi:hypothetical protein C444_11792 [Haloarcula japonica DSM 6131]|uniref:Uncharacterized protein n=2 Tax=Haloarcula japonica TaxID=29282 RepID=M0L7E5_HALJT|nr:hypothetical protein C444_11792 [Haloarcula japonica DSM 6131]
MQSKQSTTNSFEVVPMSDAENHVEPPEDGDESEIPNSGPSPARRGATPDNLPEEHRPNLPHVADGESTDWSQYTAYRCCICQDNCINKIDSDYARARECRHCYAVPALDRHSTHDPALDR